MNPRTLEALRASIEKWERNAGMTDTRQMKVKGADCPLCQLFILPEAVKSSDDWCKGCPVFDNTGRIQCSGTPYEEVVDFTRTDSERIAAAQAEVEFLRSLLPEDEA